MGAQANLVLCGGGRERFIKEAPLLWQAIDYFNP